MKKGISRRFFFQKTSTAVIAGGALAYGVAGVPLLRSKENLLRPPGALDEDTFLASCIKCGQCLQVCPPQIIKLANISEGFGIGTPYIIPQEGACILCKGLPCVLACPTGALDHHISEGSEADMGLAVLSQPETCLARKGENDLLFELQRSEAERKTPLVEIFARFVEKLSSIEKQLLSDNLGQDALDPSKLAILVQQDSKQMEWLKDFIAKSEQGREGCRICLETCPIKSEQTIIFEAENNSDSSNNKRPVVQRTCVGCGVCEEKCPTSPPSITIIPRKKWVAENNQNEGQS